jgi:hypothetical protein
MDRSQQKLLQHHAVLTLIIINIFSAVQAVPKLPIPDLLVKFDPARQAIDEVFINYNSAGEGWAIANFEERYVRESKTRSLEKLYKELPTQASLLSSYEVLLINRICTDLSKTLAILDRTLLKEKWDFCAEIDFELVPFMYGFYYLLASAHCEQATLPAAIRIAPEQFDATLPSIKTDTRVNQWQTQPEHILKLRIAIKELIYQIEEWQKSELANPERNAMEDRSQGFLQAYALFIQLYF